MSTVQWSFVTLLGAIVIACSIVATVGAILRRWLLAVRCARVAVLCSLLHLPLFVFLFGQVANGDASDKATLIATGIAEAMNWAALSLPAVLVSGLVWWTGSRRLRKQPRQAAAPSA